MELVIHEGCWQSSLIHLITLSQNFVEVWWWSLFRSTSLGKQCTSYNAPPTSRKCVADHQSLWNFLPRNCMGQYLSCMVDILRDFYRPLFPLWTQNSVRSCPMWFMSFPNHEKGAPRQEISKWSTGCSMFSRSGWSIVRNASLAK
jgi:hypothetical protein